MVRSFKQRVVVALASTLAAAACGTLAGYLAGRAVTLKLAQGRLVQYATGIMGEGEASSLESRTMLATLNASPWPYCSDAELAWFRTLIFRSEYLQDAGHMRDGKIDCSATLGRETQSLGKSRPVFSQQDGSRLYRDIAPLRIDGLTVISLQLGNSYVVFNPYSQKHRDAAPMHYTLTVTGASQGQSGQLVGGSPQANERILLKDGESRLNGSLYATRCSPRFFNCVTAYMTVPEALQASRGELRAYILLGGLTGALFGLVISILYRRSRSMEPQLRRAIRADKLRMVYQPIVDLASGRIVGAETLARWTDEDGFAVGPEVFVKIAEQHWFVGGITRLVVHHALRDFGETLRSHPDFQLNVNVAAADLGDPGFPRMLEKALDEAGVLPPSLTIEITESSTAKQHVAQDAIVRLRQRGHKVHIDDFGTGYSSLSYLSDLSVDAIKIDQSFTRAIGTEAVTVGILPQILAMAEALHLQVIVEGIETLEQASYFSGTKKPVLAQGWLFGHPVPTGEFHRILAEREREAQVLVGAA